eukprot:COSAG05_NODE_9340_length_630_cov_19.376648_1_plen_36_part_10
MLCKQSHLLVAQFLLAELMVHAQCTYRMVLLNIIVG